MVNVLDKKDILHLNLFNKVTGLSTRFCFRYNEAIVFTVPKPFVSKAVGKNGENAKRMNRVTGKRIKIIGSPEGEEDIKRFIGDVVSPVGFNDLEVIGDEIIITAGSQHKAALIGRNRRRLLELQEIAKDFFKKELRIA